MAEKKTRAGSTRKAKKVPAPKTNKKSSKKVAKKVTKKAAKKVTKKKATKRTTKPAFKPDYRLLEKVAGLFPTNEELAGIMGCSRSTIDKLKREDDKFKAILTEAHANTRMKLRQLQMKTALKGNVTMLIFLGKQYLGQSDAQKLLGDPESPVETKVNLDAKQAKLLAAAIKSPTA